MTKLYDYSSLHRKNRLASSVILKDSKDLTERLKIDKKLPAHTGCVNTICWTSESGAQHILSGSDDRHLAITNAFSGKRVCFVATGHHENIFNARFIPHSCDKKIVSCSGDGIVFYTDLNRLEETRNCCFNCCLGGPVYDVRVIPDTPNIFLTCGEDGTVRLFDLRVKTSCTSRRHCLKDVIVDCQVAVNTIDVNNSRLHEIACGCSDSSIRLFDMRMLSARSNPRYNANPFASFILDDVHTHRVTCVKYNWRGDELLASFSAEKIFLLQPNVLVKRNVSAVSVKSTSETESEQESKRRERRSYKRLRLRGDWSDTGPQSRPFAERCEEESTGPGNFVERITRAVYRLLSENDETEHNEDENVNNNLNNDVRANNDTLRRDVSETLSEVVHSVSTDVMSTNTANICTEAEGVISEMVQKVSETEIKQQEDASMQECVNENNVIEISDVAASSLNSERRNASNSPSVVNNSETISVVQQQTSQPCESNAHSSRNASQSNDVARVESESSDTGRGNTTTSSRNETNLFSANLVISAFNPYTSENLLFSRSTTSDTMSSENDVNDYDDDDDDDESGRERNRSDERRTFFARKFDRTDPRKLRRQQMTGLKSLPNLNTLQTFSGHRNVRTMIKECAFWGEDYVMSGSDCGHLFVWKKSTGNVVALYEGDSHVVNCIQPHPTLPVLATSGIDYDIKVWYPDAEKSCYDENEFHRIMNRNNLMLQETRDTVTIPAPFLLRLLTSLSRARLLRSMRIQENP